MKRSESTNDKIVRLYNEGWTAERIAEEITISTGAVNSILERRIEGYAEYLAKKSLATNKAKTAAKEESAKKAAKERSEAEAAKDQSETEAAKAKEAAKAVKAAEEASAPGGMLVESYKQEQTEPKEEQVTLLTSEEKANLLTGDLPEAAKEPARTPARRTAATARTARARAAEKPEVTEEAEVKVPTGAASPVTRANQKIKAFATSQIEENNAKIAEVEAKLAVINKQAAELRSQIAALKIENEQFQAIIK